MQRQLLKRSQNRTNKSEASFVSTESLELISNLFWTIYNDDCSCSVVQMERWSVLLRIRDDQTHTHWLHIAHTTIQAASKNRNSTMVSTHIRSAEGRKTDGHTHTRTRSQNIGNLVLSVCARLLMFYNRKIRGLFVGSPLFSPGILNNSSSLSLVLLLHFPCWSTFKCSLVSLSTILKL